MMPINVWTLASILAGGALLTWNVSSLRGGDPYLGGTERLLYLPEPEVARVFAGGHPNTVAKLKWIASFKYFQYQIDARDDSVAGGDDRRGAFERLYHTLVALDPLFVPYYEYGVTAIGGLVDQHHAELALLQQGTYHRPDSSRLWQLKMSCLRVFFDLEQRNPELMEQHLRQWADAERAIGSGREYWPLQWIASMGRRYDLGLLQAGYWGQQLISSDPDSQRGRLALSLMREQIARHGERRLNALIQYGVTEQGRQVTSWRDLTDPKLIAVVYRQQQWPLPLGPGEPLRHSTEGLLLRSDPFGHPYQIKDGAAVSTGLLLQGVERSVATANRNVREAAREQGRWPQSLDEATTMIGHALPEPPPGHQLVLADGSLQLVADATDVTGQAQTEMPTAWTIEELLAAAGIVVEGGGE